MEVAKVKIIKSSNLKELEKKIKNFLNRNYRIEGSLIVTSDQCFFMVMIK
jgi:hypothetical protein